VGTDTSTDEKPLCLVYGNCQGEPIRRLLEESPAFRSRYRTVRIQGVHEITESEVTVLREHLLPRTSLFIHQLVKDGYRDLPLGSGELAQLAPEHCELLAIPNLHYHGLFPFQVEIDHPNPEMKPAPIIVYHDIRFLFCARMGWDDSTAREWFADYAPEPAALRQIAADSAAELRRREALVDVHVTEQVLTPTAHSFFAINHPTNESLFEITRAIHSALDLPYDCEPLGEELLGQVRTPLEPCVIDALGLDLEPVPNWIAYGKSYSPDELLAAHLAWYRSDPTTIGLEQHPELMTQLGLEPGAF
jgi:hypothetical protein